MRGKVLCVVDLFHQVRITPAYAGKRDEFDAKVQAEKDHPRICGEKEFNIDIPLGSRGSPPHMRGKGDLCCLPKLRVGITPAYAGKSWVISTSCICARDHPRICGEKKEEDDAADQD